MHKDMYVHTGTCMHSCMTSTVRSVCLRTFALDEIVHEVRELDKGRSSSIVYKRIIAD